jgi:hypothetical protein
MPTWKSFARRSRPTCRQRIVSTSSSRRTRRKPSEFDDDVAHEHGVDMGRLVNVFGLKPVEENDGDPDTTYCEHEGEAYDDKLKECVAVDCRSPRACPSACEVCQRRYVECSRAPCPQFVCSCRNGSGGVNNNVILNRVNSNNNRP